MVATRHTRRPNLSFTLGAGTQIQTIEFIKAGAGQPKFVGCLTRGEFTGAMAGQQVANKGSWQPFDEL